MNNYSKTSVGSKAYTLLQLQKRFLVPTFACVTTKQIGKILLDLGITNKQLMQAFNGSSNDLELLQKRILKGNKLPNLPGLSDMQESLIIRSSAVGEDGTKHSFAGIYESKTTSKKNFVKDFFTVLSHCYSDRVQAYSKTIGLQKFPEVSLIVQEYVPPEYSGVTFTNTQYQQRRGMLINAVKGSAEAAVRGEHVTEVFIANNNIPSSTIPKSVIQQAYRLGKEVEKYYGTPQDVEWGVIGTKTFVYQSRPLTKDVESEVIVWDNSNIAESYSGIVLPLTCSFAKYIYAQVYRDVARTSHIHPKKIRDHSEVFENLLGFIQGRFYYNILNWYKMLTLFPGYERNKRNLDRMISIKSQAELAQRHKKNVTLPDKLTYYFHNATRVIVFEQTLKNFKRHTKQYLRKVRTLDLSSKSPEQLWRLFEEFQSQLLRRWSVTVDNDFLAMTWFGYLQKAAKNKGLSKNEIVSLITDMDFVISAAQVTQLKKLSKEFHNHETLVKLAMKNQWDECYNEMMNTPALEQQVNAYLDTYGGRFANELKLETEDLESDHTYLPQLLHSYQDTNNPKPIVAKNKRKHGLILQYLARKTKHYLKHREELRLLRSQAFSHTRRLFLELGEQLANKKQLADKNDIFYLNLEEIRAIVFQESKIDIKSLVKKRKHEYEKYKKVELDNVLIVRPGETPETNKKQTGKTSKSLQGIGCSQGIITGKITILNKFTIPKKPLDIIVVKHTDPGWTPIFGLCKGLIVENGGLLSHAAIISRELNLPCVIGVENATRILKNNQTVTMNATTGKIRLEGK